MIERIFTLLTNAMAGGFTIALLAALGWGILSVLLSPCHLSGIPLVIGYISKTRGGSRKSFGISSVFAAGILTSVAVIGIVTAGLGRMLGDLGGVVDYLVPVILILAALNLLDFIPLRWRQILPRSAAIHGVRGALLLGLFFGIGVGPCTFAFMAPVLTVVLAVANKNALHAGLLLGGFGFGEAGIIAIAGGIVGATERYLRWTDQSKVATYIRRTAGVLVMIFALYLLVF